MPEINSVIHQLSDRQAVRLLVLVKKKFEAGYQFDPAFEGNSLTDTVNETNSGNLARLLLTLLVLQDNKIGVYVQNCLSNNQVRFEEEQFKEEQTRSADLIELLPYAAAALALLRGKVSLERKDGRLNFFISAELLSWKDFLEIFKPAQIEHTTITGENIQFAGNLYVSFIPEGEDLNRQVEALQKEISSVKHEILTVVETGLKELESTARQETLGAIESILQGMTENDARILQAVMEELENIPSSKESEKIFKALDKQMNVMENMQEEVKIIRSNTKTKDPIQTKLKISIPLLPFMSVVHEYSVGNPLSTLWQKCKNMVV